MLDQDAEKPFYRTEQRPVHHVRAVPQIVGANVLHLEALGQHVVDLYGRYLPLAPDRIADMDVDLRGVKGSPTLRNRIFDLSGIEGSAQGVGRLVPFFNSPEVFFGPRGQFSLELGEAKTPEHLEHEGEQARKLAFQLLASAKYMAVILREAARPQEPVEHSGALEGG